MLIKLLTPASDDTKLVTPFIDLEGFNAKRAKLENVQPKSWLRLEYFPLYSEIMILGYFKKKESTY